MIKAHKTNSDAFVALLKWGNVQSEPMILARTTLSVARATNPPAKKLLETPTSSAANSVLVVANGEGAHYYCSAA